MTGSFIFWFVVDIWDWLWHPLWSGWLLHLPSSGLFCRSCSARSEVAFLKRSQRPGTSCYDSSPLSLFYLDISTSYNYICETSDAQKWPFVRRDNATGAKTKQPEHDDNYCTGSSHAPGRKWWKICNEACLRRLDLVWKTVSFCDPWGEARVDYWHKYMLSGLFFAATFAFVAPCMSRMIDAACQDSIMTVSLFLRCPGFTSGSRASFNWCSDNGSSTVLINCTIPNLISCDLTAESTRVFAVASERAVQQKSSAVSSNSKAISSTII